ncbi:MAG: hypothetical protein LWX11_06905, partial [Firmicutes bacterium]|nr:hypothetical protein [Bacillota bacterium]
MNSLGWDELRMNEDEAQALLRSRLPQEFSEGRIQEICRMADGWPAGLSLMAVENGSGMPRANGGIGRERLFDFFASEILGQIRPMTRELLLQMSVFPRFTPRQAQALTGLTSAETELKRLAGSGHFTMARPGVEPVYEFHPLFRDFLRRQAVETRSRRAWCALQERAGMSLAEDGQLYEAFDCYREAGAVERQVALLKAHVMPFLAKGQHHTVQAWINSLPASRIEEDPWILVWKGISGIPTDPKGSFACLEKAFHRFGRVGESAGQMAAWSAVVESRHYGWDEYASLDSWIHWMDQHEKAFEALDETPIREAVTVSMVWALLRRFPTHPRMEQWVKRCERTMKESLQPQVRMQAGMGAFMYRFWGGEQTACEALAQEARLQAASLQEP